MADLLPTLGGARSPWCDVFPSLTDEPAKSLGIYGRKTHPERSVASSPTAEVEEDSRVRLQ